MPVLFFRRFNFRAAFVRNLRRLSRKGISEATEALRDGDVIDQAYEQWIEEYPIRVGGSFVDAMKEFLQFLFDNQDKLVALIKVIITLFSMPNLRFDVIEPETESVNLTQPQLANPPPVAG